MSRTRLIHALCLVLLIAGLSGILATGAAAQTPRLGSGSIFPTSGDTNTLFTFMMVFYGPTKPTVANLYLDDMTCAMTYAGCAPYNGINYTYKTKLTAGTHKYRYEFKVGDVTLLKPGPAADDWTTSFSVRQAPSFSIGGTIKCNGVALTRVMVKLTKSGSPTVTVYTGRDGKYSATGLAPGTWVVTPTITGYTMTPVSQKVTGPPDTATCDFTATRTGRTG